jgi:hypothetical protein
MRSVSPWTAIHRPNCKVLVTRCHAKATITEELAHRKSAQPPNSADMKRFQNRISLSQSEAGPRESADVPLELSLLGDAASGRARRPEGDAALSSIKSEIPRRSAARSASRWSQGPRCRLFLTK